MKRALAVLRPEPGNAATAARIEALGLRALRLPLFAVRPVAWAPPAGNYDALLLTSANAVRHAGAGLATVRHLPVRAVGAATAAAARAAGLTVAATGTSDAAAIAAGGGRLLHLAGRDRVALPGVDAVTVYAAEPVEVDAGVLPATVALLHSARAAARLAELVAPDLRETMRVAALSPAVAAASGGGWARILSAEAPTDSALVALAAGLAAEPD